MGRQFQIVIDLPPNWGVENATRAAVEIQKQFNEIPDSGEIKVRARKVRPGHWCRPPQVVLDVLQLAFEHGGKVATQDQLVEVNRWINEVIGQARYEARPGKLALEHVVDWAKQHQREHPSHGINCACADDMIRQVRIASRVEGANDWQHTPSGHAPWEAQKRVDYVLDRGSANRY